MNKMKVLSFASLFLAVSLAVSAVAPKIEHLVWADTGYDAVFIYELTPPDPTIRLDYKSKPFLTFKVPGSPAANTIFFEWNGSLVFNWSGDVSRVMVGEVICQISSSLIPAGVVVRGGFTLGHISSNNAADSGQIEHIRWARYFKVIMRKDKLDWWGVYYEATGDPYPDAQALIAKLLKKGFEVQVRAEGIAKGVGLIQYIQVSVQATRLAL
jgi:hypothetical protein